MTRKERRFVEALLEWHKRNRRIFPWRVDPDPYRVLVAEVLLQRTPANRVAKLFPAFISRFPNPGSMLSAKLSILQDVLKPMGLQKRSEWLLKLMSELREKYSCKVPDNEGELLSLPGVGLYTARAVLSFGFRKDVAVVDVNVSRVLSRVFGMPSRNLKPSEDENLWAFAAELVPESSASQYNEALLDFAAIVCRKRPRCEICLISEICEYYKKNN